MVKLSYSELKKGTQIILNSEPYEILETLSMFKGRGHSVLQAKLKNLATGNIIQKTFHPSDSFEEADVSRFKANFIYSHREKFVFSEKDNPKKRFELTKEQIGESAKFLKQGLEVEGMIFNNKIINISLPIKVQLKVIQAPPGLKGDRAQAGNKIVVLETNAELSVPLFIEEGDII
ncbi:MAG TPA: hypothetical protein ENL27_01155, partial [Candidatus Parcubacteria bacterium]|nr:hypothetical protein [Candidatus Parcubacteria bacterium]